MIKLKNNENNEQEFAIVLSKNGDGVKERFKTGDVWRLGNHLLYCGDCCDSGKLQELLKMQGVDIADLVLTDPPYGVSIVKVGKLGGSKPMGRVRGSAGKLLKFNGAKTNRFVKAGSYEEIVGDDSTEIARKSYEVVKSLSRVQIYFGGNYFSDFLPPSRCFLVWDKGMSSKVNYAMCELAWVSKDRNAKIYKHLWSGLCRAGNRKIELEKRIHPTQKPVGLAYNILKDFSKSGDVVLDVFAGSGWSLIACELSGRKNISVEISPKYCDLILWRWERLTGRVAEKVS